MKSQLSFLVVPIMVVTFLSAEQFVFAQDSVRVTVVGTVRTGIVAIGGETTGTIIKAKNITWELDFGKNAALRKAAAKLNGKKAVVQGTLARRKGVEIKDRWIVTVTSLKAFERGNGGVKGQTNSRASASAKSFSVTRRPLDYAWRFQWEKETR